MYAHHPNPHPLVLPLTHLQVSCVAWHPKAGLTQDPSAVNLMSSDADGVVKCWSAESDTAIATLTGHSKRVAAMRFHPSGKFLATACYDHSWRLWDIEQRTEILHQEGHSREVHCLAFHPDGSLIGTGGAQAPSRVSTLLCSTCHFGVQNESGVK